MVASNIIHCVLVLMTTTVTQVFLYQVQTMLLYDLKANHARVKKANLLLQWLWRTVEKLQELYEFVLFVISADWVFFETSY